MTLPAPPPAPRLQIQTKCRHQRPPGATEPRGKHISDRKLSTETYLKESSENGLDPGACAAADTFVSCQGAREGCEAGGNNVGGMGEIGRAHV